MDSLFVLATSTVVQEDKQEDVPNVQYLVGMNCVLLGLLGCPLYALSPSFVVGEEREE